MAEEQPDELEEDEIEMDAEITLEERTEQPRHDVEPRA